MVNLSLMSAVLFDADNKKVSCVKFDGELDTLYTYLKCDLVDTIRLDNNHIIFVDDEGLLKNNEIGWIVRSGDRSVDFVGSGLLVGDSFGESTNVSLDLEKLKITMLKIKTTTTEYEV